MFAGVSRIDLFRCMVLNNALFCVCPSGYTGPTCLTQITGRFSSTNKTKSYVPFCIGPTDTICNLASNICKNGGT